jgi:hypothetical protein
MCKHLLPNDYLSKKLFTDIKQMQDPIAEIDDWSHDDANKEADS